MQEKLKVNWHACTNCGSDLILAKNESECRGCSGFDLVHLILREVDAFHLVSMPPRPTRNDIYGHMYIHIYIYWNAIFAPGSEDGTVIALHADHLLEQRSTRCAVSWVFCGHRSAQTAGSCRARRISLTTTGRPRVRGARRWAQRNEPATRRR